RISLQKNALASLKACSTSWVFQLALRVSGFRSRTRVMISQLRHPQWRNLANASFFGIDVPAGRFCGRRIVDRLAHLIREAIKDASRDHALSTVINCINPPSRRATAEDWRSAYRKHHKLVGQ